MDGGILGRLDDMITVRGNNLFHSFTDFNVPTLSMLSAFEPLPLSVLKFKSLDL